MLQHLKVLIMGRIRFRLSTSLYKFTNPSCSSFNLPISRRQRGSLLDRFHPGFFSKCCGEASLKRPLREKLSMDRLLRKRMRLAPTTWDKVESEPGALPNLFLRFPVKTLSQCKTVCSRWCKEIRSPSFEEKQLSVSKAKPTYIVYPYVDEVTNVYMVDADGEVTEKVTLPGCDNLSFLSMTCSCSGLVCLTNCPWDSDSELSLVDYSGLEIRMCSPQCIMDSHNMFVDGKVYWFLPSEEDHRIAGPSLFEARKS